jgi:putative transposase
MKERKLMRLKDYNYSQSGYYFVTICTKDRREYFGSVEEGRVNLSKYGEVVNKCWYELFQHYLGCSLDSFVIMQNHVHGIIVIDNENMVGNGFKPFPTKIINWRRTNETKRKGCADHRLFKGDW